MALLSPLTKTALLGTGTEPLVCPPALPPLDAALAQVDSSDPEAALLKLASVAGLAGLAGYVPGVAAPLMPPAQPDQQKLIPEAAVQSLKRILAGEFEDVLPEFLQLAARKKMRLPPETLPAVLSLGKYELRPLVLQVIGERGRWLAAQNPAWAYALRRAPQEAWENGSRPERVAALETLRAEDPAGARALVQSTWEQDAPDDRAAFLAAFAIGLTMNDEPFLETCLDDKRKAVRTAAQALLVRLPKSRLAQRMFNRLDDCVRLKSKFLGGDSFEVSLPERLDAAAKRDGVLDDASDLVQYRKMGEKASWLALMLALVPPSLWSQRWGKSPEKLLAAALACEWNQPLIIGLRAAAQLSQDMDWAEAMVNFWLKQEACRKLLGREHLWGLVMQLPERVMEAVVTANSKPRLAELTDDSPLLALLGDYKRPWTAKMARPIVQSARRLASGQGRSYGLSQALPSYALWIPPSLADEFARGWPDEPKTLWKSKIEEFLALLDFRRQLHDVLS